MEIILASGSRARRKELLGAMGLTFSVRTSCADDDHRGRAAALFCCGTALFVKSVFCCLNCEK